MMKTGGGSPSFAAREPSHWLNAFSYEPYRLRSAPSSKAGRLSGETVPSLRPRFGSSGPTFGHKWRYFTSTDTASSSTGTRGIFTIPDSIASTSPKSLTTHGNRVPSRYPEPDRNDGVADRS